MEFCIPDIFIRDYDYLLPPEKIAQYPLGERDASRLLILRAGQISTDSFSHLDRHLPPGTLLVFNDTRVIHARLIFKKPTGAVIEIFCLEPIGPSTEIQAAFQHPEFSTWKCLVGNLKRWKSGILRKTVNFQGKLCQLSAELTGDLGEGCYAIAFHWDPSHLSFSEILEITGLVPLPPYIGRDTAPDDAIRYQTIYAAHEGSVAAPTAGLHFTKPLLDRLHTAGYKYAYVTLHVGVGTFRPVTVPDIRNHLMHKERIVVSRETIEKLLTHIDRPVFAIGTTSARTIESLYWLGVKILSGCREKQPEITQWEPYRDDPPGIISPGEALDALLDYLYRKKLDAYIGETQLMIVPGYTYRLLSGMITNFHMPRSTLLLLVAAMVGEKWKVVYNHALSHDFRFLSYGDSCLFFNHQG